MRSCPLRKPNGLPNHDRDARKGEGGIHVELSSSEPIVLMCEECEEKVILLGPEEDWRSRRAVFVCEEGHKLTLDGRTEEEVLAAS